jgi:HPt (histidine-containing phosphotransfer) domain-containing protein
MPLSLQDALDRCDGSLEILRAQVAFVLEDAPGYLADLEATLAAGRCREAERPAHSLTGSMLSVDADYAAVLARKIEFACQQDDAQEATGLFPELQVEVRRILAELASWSSERSEAAR